VLTNRVQKFDSSGNLLGGWGSYGTGNGQFAYPRGITVDSADFVYVLDTNNNRVQKFDASGTFVAAWGSYGTGPGAFFAPEGIEAAGTSIYVADTRNNRVQQFDGSGTWIASWGSYGTGDGLFRAPTAVAADADGFLFVADRDNNRVQKFDAQGLFLAAWGSAGSGQGQFSAPLGIAVNRGVSPAEVIVADTGNNRIERFDLAGVYLGTFGQGGLAGGVFNGPIGLALDGIGNRYVVDAENHRIQKFDSSGTFVSAWGKYGSGDQDFNSQRDVAFAASDGVLYVSDGSNRRIKKFTPDGTLLSSWGISGGGTPFGVAMGSVAVYVVVDSSSKVQKYDTQGALLLEWGSPGTANGQFTFPRGVVVDAAGAVYVTDQTRVQKFDAQGQFLLSWQVAADTRFIAAGADGYLYLSAGSGEVHRYDSSGQLITIWRPTTPEDEWNNPWGIARAADGTIVLVDSGHGRVARFSDALPLGRVLTGITDAVGQTTHLLYGSNGRVSTLEDPLGRQAHFVYEDRLDLVSGTDMEGIESSLSYNQYGDILSITLPSGTYLFRYTAGETGSPAYVEDPLGKRRQYPWIAHFSNGVTDPLGNTTVYDSNANGAISRVASPESTTTSYAYDTEGNRTGVTDGESHTVSWTVDARGRTTSSTDALGRTTTWVYDDVNHTETMTGPAPLSPVTIRQLDAQENLLSITDPAAKVTNMTYYADGRLHTVSTPLAKTTTYVYDDQQRTTTLTDPLGRQTVLTMDALGHMVRPQDPLGRVTEYGYDALGRRRWMRNPDQTERSWDYLCCGVSAETDEAGRQIEYLYDSRRLLTAVVNQADPATPRNLASYGYDDAGRRGWMKDYLERQTTYGYDGRGWLTSTTCPDASFEARTYFKDQSVKTRTDRAGHTTTYAYDNAGRLLTKTYPDTSTVGYTYDEMGRTLTAVAGQTAVAYTYLQTGQVETMTQTLFGVGKTFRYQYYDDGRLQWWRDESVTPNKTTTSTYYDDGRLWQLTDGDGQTFSFEYNADGSLKKKTYPNGMWAECEYDADRGWLTALRHRKSTQTSGIMAQFLHKDAQGNPWYDAVGNRTQADVTGNEHHTYAYDPYRLDRLLTVDRPQTSNDESYTYDEMGNRLTSRQYTNWSYDPQNDELDSWDAVSYAYDANGNRATKTEAGQTTTYTYDYENRLVRADLPGGAWVTYDYDALGRRVRKNNNGTVTLYWYEGEDIVLETDAAGVEQARYTHGPGIDSPLKVKRGGSAYYYHEDPLGSIVLMTNASKNSSRTYKYDAFGNIISQSGSLTNFYQYTGREWDGETALYYYRARTYDPKVGRFLQQDPIPPRPEDMNPFVYTGNNPTNRTDPTGKGWFDDFLDCPIGATEVVPDSGCPSGARLYYNCTKYRCIGYVDQCDPHGKKCKGILILDLGPTRLKGPCTSQGIPI
jgi:RHS repeat-associated protein